MVNLPEGKGHFFKRKMMDDPLMTSLRGHEGMMKNGLQPERATGFRLVNYSILLVLNDVKCG